MRFQGTKKYIATDDLKLAVDASLSLEKPLLIKGEPGTGKTMLAVEVAQALDMRLIEWHIKSTTKASQGLYEYDAVSRLRDSQLGDEKVKDIANYINKGKLWDAFTSEEQVVLLYAGVNGYMDTIEVNQISDFENQLMDSIKKDYSNILDDIKSSNTLSDESEELLKKALDSFLDNFKKNS